MHGPNISPDGFLGRLKSHKVIEWTLAYAALAPNDCELKNNHLTSR